MEPRKFSTFSLERSSVEHTNVDPTLWELYGTPRNMEVENKD